jgi:hypothetical protein
VRCVGCGDAAADQLSVSLVVVVSNFVFCFWTVFRQTTSSIWCYTASEDVLVAVVDVRLYVKLRKTFVKANAAYRWVAHFKRDGRLPKKWKRNTLKLV